MLYCYVTSCYIVMLLHGLSNSCAIFRSYVYSWSKIRVNITNRSHKFISLFPSVLRGCVAGAEDVLMNVIKTKMFASIISWNGLSEVG